MGSVLIQTGETKKSTSTVVSSSHGQSGLITMRTMLGHSRRFQVIPGSQVVLVDPRHRGFLFPLEVQLGQSLAVRPWSDIHRHQGAPVCLALPEDPFGPRHLVHPKRQCIFRNKLTLSCMGC